jgi:hypothetical protein
MRQALRAAAASTAHYERRRPEETTLYRLVQENLETFIVEVEAGGAASLPQFVKDEFDAFLECGILAHGFLRVRCAECGHEKLVAFFVQAARHMPFVRGGGAWRKRPLGWSIA